MHRGALWTVVAHTSDMLAVLAPAVLAPHTRRSQPLALPACPCELCRSKPVAPTVAPPATLDLPRRACTCSAASSPPLLSASSPSALCHPAVDLTLDLLLPNQPKEQQLEQLVALQKWLKGLPLARRPLVKLNAVIAPEAAVKMLQAALPPRAKEQPPIELENVAATLLLPPTGAWMGGVVGRASEQRVLAQPAHVLMCGCGTSGCICVTRRVLYRLSILRLQPSHHHHHHHPFLIVPPTLHPAASPPTPHPVLTPTHFSLF